MSTLTVVVTHLEAERVHETIELLQLVTREKLLVCHAGRREDFDQINFEPKVFIEDPTLRGPARHLQSWTEIFEAAWWTCFESDESLDSLYLVEYDHLIVDPDFDQRLARLADSAGADFLGKNCVERTATNWQHYVRFRRDERLLAHLRRVSIREDRERLFGCLGDGMWLTRGALEAYVRTPDHPPCYCETYVPTLLHHLGLRVVDVDAHSDLYQHVRWDPPFDRQEAQSLLQQGGIFLHPVKDRDAVAAVLDALRPAGGRRSQTRE